MKRYRYIFHFVSGNSCAVNLSTRLDMSKVTSQPWFFIDEQEVTENVGLTINVNNIEFIETQIIDKK